MQLESKWEKEEGYNHIWEIMDNNKGNAVLFFFIFFSNLFIFQNLPLACIYDLVCLIFPNSLKKQVIT